VGLNRPEITGESPTLLRSRLVAAPSIFAISDHARQDLAAVAEGNFPDRARAFLELVRSFGSLTARALLGAESAQLLR
jgi:hypothetical protein